MRSDNLIHLGLGNYYGDVIARKEEGKFYLELENWDGFDKVEISEELYRLIEKEFESK